MIGIILMIIGVLTLGVGIILYSTSKSDVVIHDTQELDKIVEMAMADGVLTPNEKSMITTICKEKGLDSKSILDDIKTKLAINTDVNETELVNQNKKKGDDFEKYVAQKFDKKYFTIKSWAGDKYVNGVYAQNTLQPDLLLDFSFKGQHTSFSVECKWRSKFYKNGIEFASESQLKRYKCFAKKVNHPVFIALGVGGKANEPESLFILPLNQLESNFISKDQLDIYSKQTSKNFFFDSETKKLR